MLPRTFRLADLSICMHEIEANALSRLHVSTQTLSLLCLKRASHQSILALRTDCIASGRSLKDLSIRSESWIVGVQIAVPVMLGISLILAIKRAFD